MNGIKVKLQIYYEQGMEGIEWSAHDHSKQGYEGLVLLKEGDYLVIPGEWEGYIKYNHSINRTWNYSGLNKPLYLKKIEEGCYREVLEKLGYNTTELSNIECETDCKKFFTRQKVQGYICHWLQENVDPILWCSYFQKELDAYYVDSSYIKCL
jgi:hypothetical protein